jgi:D-alanyl-D-alanine carboxypeptidase
MNFLLDGDMRLNPDAVPVINSIYEKTRILRASPMGATLRIISHTELSHNLTDEENYLFSLLREIDTSKLGVTLPQQSSDYNGEQLVVSPDQLFVRNHRLEWTGGRHITSTALAAFSAMSRSAETELGAPFILQSAYRSPAYQGLLFIDTLVGLNYDVETAVKRASVPGFSEHADTDWLATDIMPHTVNAVGFRFQDTAEYAWLREYAEQFDFYESYPEGNDAGLVFEPWHWQHRPIK